MQFKTEKVFNYELSCVTLEMLFLLKLHSISKIAFKRSLMFAVFFYKERIYSLIKIQRWLKL